MDEVHETMGEGSNLAIPGIGLTLRVRSLPCGVNDTLTILETTNAPGFGPPFHRHHETEIFRVLEGEYLYQVEEKRFKARPGDLITVPGGVPHGFVSTSAQPAKQLVLMLPAMDAYRFFKGLGDLMSEGRPSSSQLNDFGRPWGVELLGPPLKAS